MSECCGVECRSRFCPQCGKRASQEPLVGLLVHVRGMAASQRSKAGTAHREYESDDSAGKFHDRMGRRAVNAEAAAAKWERWRDALAALLEKGGTS